MEFDQLRTLLAVLEHGSFTRAAEALGLSQSTVSFHVKGLEAAVGSRLLDRGRDGVRATPQGEVLRGYAERLWALRGEALEQLRAESHGQRGRVVVAASMVDWVCWKVRMSACSWFCSALISARIWLSSCCRRATPTPSSCYNSAAAMRSCTIRSATIPPSSFSNTVS